MKLPEKHREKENFFVSFRLKLNNSTEWRNWDGEDEQKRQCQLQMIFYRPYELRQMSQIELQVELFSVASEQTNKIRIGRANSSIRHRYEKFIADANESLRMFQFLDCFLSFSLHVTSPHKVHFAIKIPI